MNPFLFTERMVPCGRHSLRVVSGPQSGPPLLLLHGVSRCWQDFAPLLPALACRWHLFAVDFRGHGRSHRCPGRYVVLDYFADVAALLQHYLPAPAVIYGHSLGALVALAAAALVPTQVQALILEDPPAPHLLANLPQSPYYDLFSGMQGLAGSDRPTGAVAAVLAELPVRGPNGTTCRLGDVRDGAALRFSARCLRDLDAEVLSPLLEGRWLEGYELDAFAAGAACPTLLLRGDDTTGGMLNAADADHLAGRMADCTRIDVPGAGHQLHWLATDTVLRLTSSFLESLV
jgi:pimeloyl-ACP methyl ester carboxylesterase